MKCCKSGKYMRINMDDQEIKQIEFINKFNQLSQLNPPELIELVPWRLGNIRHT